MKRRKTVSKPPTAPTEQDWGDYQLDLDQNDAHSVFSRRTNEEMQPFFERNVIEMTDELRWTPEVPFRYYMLGFRDFVMTMALDFPYAPDAASCFLGLILEKLEGQPRYIVPIIPDLLPAIEYVASNQHLFEADESIYGQFLDKLARIKILYEPYGLLIRRKP